MSSAKRWLVEGHISLVMIRHRTLCAISAYESLNRKHFAIPCVHTPVLTQPHNRSIMTLFVSQNATFSLMKLHVSSLNVLGFKLNEHYHRDMNIDLLTHLCEIISIRVQHTVFQCYSAVYCSAGNYYKVWDVTRRFIIAAEGNIFLRYNFYHKILTTWT